MTTTELQKLAEMLRTLKYTPNFIDLKKYMDYLREKAIKEAVNEKDTNMVMKNIGIVKGIDQILDIIGDDK